MAEADDIDDDADDEADEPKTEALPKPEPKPRSLLSLIVGVTVVTVVAAGLGGFLGLHTVAVVEAAVADRARAAPLPDSPRSTVFTGDKVLQALDPVITNLAQPSDTWIRLETAIVFNRDAVKNPQATAGEIRQDILSYVRTLNIADLEGPSALQHLREDLNERVAVRTGGDVSELVIQSLVIQ